MNLIDNLNWRYATKVFDNSKKINPDALEYLKESVRLSVSSYGLQLYQVLIIENVELRKKLRKASWDQKQITDASHLFVFCNYTINYDRHVDDYIQRIINAQEGKSPDELISYGAFIKSSISNMNDAERKSWCEKQTYLAMNNLLIACAEQKIDACPMEGFDNTAYNQILGLNELGLNAAVITPVGFRSSADKTQFRPKVRRSAQQLFNTIN